MSTENLNRILAVVVNSILIASPSSGYQAEESAAGGAADSAPMSASQLQALVAPIALYPDPLVAQVLAAATFPDQVAVANYWLQQNKALTGQALMQAVNSQSWDASVKALTQFPAVLDNMAKNLNWTSTLGEAYHNQPSEVMAAVQTLRAQAKAAGHLQSGPQITVTRQSPQTIVIKPTNPQVVYVPQYNPAVIYGTTYVTPGYTAGECLRVRCSDLEPVLPSARWRVAVAAGGDGARGMLTGVVGRWYITTTTFMETAPGTAATTTAPITMATVTTTLMSEAPPTEDTQTGRRI